MKNVKEYFKPATPEEAVKLFQEHPGTSCYIAGGTHVAAVKDPSIEYLIDITCCGLNTIQEQDGQLRIGAGVTLEDLLQSDLMNHFAGGILAEIARWTGSAQRRNSATTGGSLVLCQDLALPLMALETQLVVLGDSERTISLADFYGKPDQGLQEGELITACLIPAEFRNAVGKGQRMNRTRQDVTILGVAVIALQENGVCQKTNIAVEPVETGVMRVLAVEVLLQGNTITNELIQQAADTVAQSVQPIDDYRASASYRKKMLGVYAKRVLQQCFSIQE